jgi:hypothetical protein
MLSDVDAEFDELVPTATEAVVLDEGVELLLLLAKLLLLMAFVAT